MKNRNAIYLLLITLMFLFVIIPMVKASEEPVLKLVLDKKVKKPVLKTLNQTITCNNDSRKEYQFKDSNGYLLKVVYTGPPAWNGVALIDKNGNTLSSIKNALHTNEAPFVTCEVWDAVSADMNGDKKNDYYIQLRCTGNGLMQTSQCILFLSGNTYKEIDFLTYASGSDHFLDLYGDGRYFLIVEDLIYPEMTLPPLDKEEFPGITKEELGVEKDEDLLGWYNMNRPYFHIYYPLEIKGQELLEYVNADKRFPMFVSYFKGEELYGKGETKLLTKKQKNKIWKSNPTGYAEVKVRYKKFMQ